MTTYRKKSVVEATRWTPGMNLDGVTGLDQGKPEDGDWIVWNAGKPGDKWLVKSKVFEESYEQVT